MTLNQNPNEPILELNNSNAGGDKQEELALNYRKIYINDEINKETVFSAVYFLQKIYEEDSRRNIKPPISIFINSVGGYCSEGFILVDMIDQLKVKGYTINTIVTGMAYSFGVVLALAGSKKYCYRHADYMLHTVQISPPSASLPEMQRTMRNAERIQSNIEEYVLNNSKITKEQLDGFIKDGTDWYFTSNDAVVYGICDEII